MIHIIYDASNLLLFSDCLDTKHSTMKSEIYQPGSKSWQATSQQGIFTSPTFANLSSQEAGTANNAAMCLLYIIKLYIWYYTFIL